MELPFRRFLDSLSNALFPLRCMACRTFIEADSRGVSGPALIPTVASDADPRASFRRTTGKWVCPACADAFTPLPEAHCTTCGAPFISQHQDAHICGVCLEKPPFFRKARAVGLHEEPLTRLIHQLKYNARLQLTEPLGMLAYDAFRRFWTGGEIDAILPVPLHKSRFRKRGFNQSYSVIREWPRLSEKYGENRSWTIERDLLIRSRRTPPQTGLGRAERLVNIRNAFTVNAPERVAERRLLLVDDVFTTGATVNECARVLMDAGARSVDVLTLARAVRS